MNKTLTSLLISLLLIGSGLYYFNSNKTNKKIDDSNQYINNRNFFKNQGIEGLLSAGTITSPVLTYGIKYTSNLDQLANDPTNQETSNNIEITAQCYVQSTFIEDENLLEVAVQYTAIDKTITGSTTEMEEQEFDEQVLQLSEQDETNEQEELIPEFFGESMQIEVSQRQFPMYVLQVDFASGNILRVMREYGPKSDKSVEWMTQQFINDVFPDCRKSVYEQSQFEQDNLGTVEVDYEQKDFDNNTQILYREYDTHDLVQPHIENFSHPEFDYDRQVLMEKDSGIVLTGESTFVISMGKETVLTADENGNTNETVYSSGEIKGNVKQEFWKIDQLEADSKIALAILDYKENAIFAYTSLISESQPKILYGTGESENFRVVDIDEPDFIEVQEFQQKEYFEQQEDQELILSQEETDDGRNIYRESVLSSVDIFGAKLNTVLIFSGNAESNFVHIDININTHLVKRIIDLQFSQCASINENYLNTDLDFTLYEALFPVFGLVDVRVSAKAKLNFGYDFSTSGQNGECSLSVRPWVKGGLYAEGKASIVELITAKIYGQGDFLDAALVLTGSVGFNGLSTSLTGNFKAYSLEVALTYTKIECNIQNLLNVVDKLTVEEPKSNILQKSIQQRRQLGKFGKIGKVVSDAVKTPVQVVEQTVNNVSHEVEQAVSNAEDQAVHVVQDAIGSSDAIISGVVDFTGETVEKAKEVAPEVGEVVKDGSVNVFKKIGKVAKDTYDKNGNIAEAVFNQVEKVAEKYVNGVIEMTVGKIMEEAKDIIETVEELMDIAEDIKKICHIQKGFKQLHKSESPERSITLFEYFYEY